MVRHCAGGDVALIAPGELACLVETAHLLRSPRNAERLLTALARARAATLPITPLAELDRVVGFDA